MNFVTFLYVYSAVEANTFRASDLFLNPLKTSGNFEIVFRGYENVTLIWNCSTPFEGILQKSNHDDRMVNRSWNRSYECILYIYSENNTTCIRNIKTLLQIRFTNIENTPTHRNGSINVKAVLLAVLLFLKYKSFNNFSNITWPVTVGSSKKSSWTLFLWIYFLFRLINLFVQYLLTVLFLILTFFDCYLKST